MFCRAIRPATISGAAILLLTASCTPMSELDRTRDHLGQARESLVRSLSTLADDIERNLDDVDRRLADPTLRPEDKVQLTTARERLVAATDKAAASTDRQLQRDDLLPEERDSLLLTQAKLENLQARAAMSEPLAGTRAIQQRLAELGYKPGPIDGMDGPRTRAAIRAFERDQGLPQTGRATPEVITALSKAQPTAP
jgi:hypothetical protein